MVAIVKFLKPSVLVFSIPKVSRGGFFVGVLVSILILQSLPPAPAFSRNLGRATYWQSYETSYFATLRSYEKLLRIAFDDGKTPIVILGDSTIRGTGAIGNQVWTRRVQNQLEKELENVSVINLAQNAGDLMGPFLYHYLAKRYPKAYFIVQWHFPSEVGLRHPFHYWITSEIMIRDGKDNPAVKHALEIVPIKYSSAADYLRKGPSEEQLSIFMAFLNSSTNYLDLGNWF